MVVRLQSFVVRAWTEVQILPTRWQHAAGQPAAISSAKKTCPISSHRDRARRPETISHGEAGLASCVCVCVSDIYPLDIYLDSLRSELDRCH